MFCLHVYMCMVCVMGVSIVCRDQKRASDPLELKLLAAVNCTIWEPGTELECPGQTAQVPLDGVVSPAPRGSGMGRFSQEVSYLL